jgi:hypothetical protein
MADLTTPAGGDADPPMTGLTTPAGTDPQPRAPASPEPSAFPGADSAGDPSRPPATLLLDPRTARVDVRAAMGIDAGPWTVDPDGPRAFEVRWLDHARAIVVPEPAPGSSGPPAPLDDHDPVTTDHRISVVLGTAGLASRRGRSRHEVVVGGWRILLDIEPERTARLREWAARSSGDIAHAGPFEVRAIIPGRIVAVSVAEGDTVEMGQQLLVVEAMKMQNELRSPHAGVVERIAVGVGQTVEQAALLLVLR